MEIAVRILGAALLAVAFTLSMSVIAGNDSRVYKNQKLPLWVRRFLHNFALEARPKPH